MKLNRMESCYAPFCDDIVMLKLLKALPFNRNTNQIFSLDHCQPCGSRPPTVRSSSQHCVIDRDSSRSVPLPNRTAKGVEWGASSGGVFFPQPTRGVGERYKLPIDVRVGEPVGNAFLRILKITDCSPLYLYTDALSSSNSVSCHIW